MAIEQVGSGTQHVDYDLQVEDRVAHSKLLGYGFAATQIYYHEDGSRSYEVFFAGRLIGRIGYDWFTDNQTLQLRMYICDNDGHIEDYSKYFENSDDYAKALLKRGLEATR